MNHQANTTASTMEQIDQEVQLLFQEIVDVLKTKPRRTTTQIEVLLKLLHATAVQLPPAGIGDVALMLGHLAGELLQVSFEPPKTTH